MHCLLSCDKRSPQGTIRLLELRHSVICNSIHSYVLEFPSQIKPQTYIYILLKGYQICKSNANRSHLLSVGNFSFQLQETHRATLSSSLDPIQLNYFLFILWFLIEESVPEFNNTPFTPIHSHQKIRRR